MCDVFHAPGAGPTFEWPALAGDAPPPGVDNTNSAGKTWTWVNVWATWCKPCVEEMPRLRRWQAQLGDRVALHYLSADDSGDAIARYRESHPDLGETRRVADAEAMPAWLESLGVAGGALPAHVFIAPGGEVRCVRASAVEDADFAAIDALLRP